MPSSAYLVPLPTLRASRYRIAFTQAELGAATGISSSTIRRLEHGGRSSPEPVPGTSDKWDET